jgi:uncharacterized iron-regulated membrane protein
MNTIKQAKWIRAFRWLHRKIAIVLFIFFFIVSVTGLLLGWKKNTGLLAATQKGSTTNISQWLPVDSLQKMAVRYLQDSVSSTLSTELDRIDIRPSKGIAKFIFTDHYWAIQLDCATGKLLLIEKRSSDFIEDLHDGSILDSIFGTGKEEIKLVYTSIMGISLLMLILTGFWLWYGPKRLRKAKKNLKKNTLPNPGG